MINQENISTIKNMLRVATVRHVWVHLLRFLCFNNFFFFNDCIQEWFDVIQKELQSSFTNHQIKNILGKFKFKPNNFKVVLLSCLKNPEVLY